MAATVALIAIVGMIPYIALQLKAVSASVGTILAGCFGRKRRGGSRLLGDIALFVAMLMAAFAVLFGTRHIDATEHQDGLMLAVATESVIKLVAFLAVGIFVTFVMFPGPLVLFADALQQPQTAAVLTRVPPATTFACHDRAVAVCDCACCRANFTSPWSRTTARLKFAARRGCFRPISSSSICS